MERRSEFYLKRNKVSSILDTLTFKDFFSFLEEGTLGIDCSEVFRIGRCKCGDLPEFIQFKIVCKNVKEIVINVDVYCKQCYPNAFKELKR